MKKEKNRLIITPKEKKEKLEELLSKITNDNIHTEIKTGIPIGKEIW